MTGRLLALMERAYLIEMTPDEQEDRRIRFALANASYEDERVTRDHVERASRALSKARDQAEEPSG